MRATGSAALNFVYVGAGWVDLYTHLQLHPWDQAAAGLIVAEAGGALATLSGEPWTPYCHDPLITATPALCDAFRARVAAAGL
jgi:fructose-1,6-bisphosphatase/inositol monophosphatase family enzyme